MKNLSQKAMLITVLFFINCWKIDKKVVSLKNDEKHLTILKLENAKYLINGKYHSDKKPQTDYIKADKLLEWHSGLAKWNESQIEIYSHYGAFDTLASNGKLKIIKVSTKEFEELKKDTINGSHTFLGVLILRKLLFKPK